MRKYLSYSLILTTLLVLMFIYGFTPNGEKVPVKSSNIEGPNIVSGPELDDPNFNLFESFESQSFPPAGWKKFNPIGGNGWNRQTVGTAPIPGWNGGVITAPNGGQSAIAFCTWNTSGQNSTDQWLVTPQINNVQTNDSLVFWVKFPGFSANYQDFLHIMVSTTTPDINSFYLAHTIYWPAGTSDTTWKRRAFKLTNFPGVTAGSTVFIGFREKVDNNYNDGGSIFLDLTQIEVLTNIQQTSTLAPDNFKLSQNFPNPFNPATSISFSVKEKGLVSLRVYDMTGKEVAVLVNKELSSGSYNYNFDASILNSGVYFYTLRAENFTETKKMLLVK
jgi:hypothetical protein